MIDIRTFRTERKGIRVDLFRKYTSTDEKTGKPKYSRKQLGSFSLRKGYSQDDVKLLQPDEMVQLENWLAEARFAEQFNEEVDKLPKFTIHIPQTFCDILIRLYVEAKQAGIDFAPHQIMLDSLLHKSKLLQQKIDKINGFKSGIFESIGMQSDSFIAKKNEHDNVQDDAGQILFKALLELKQPIGKICTELEIAAKQYGKTRKIPPGQLKEWAENIPNRPPNKRIKKWAYIIAIDVLQEQGINPITLLEPAKVAEYWAILRQEKYTLKEAIERFIKTFNVPDKQKKSVTEMITQVYKKLIAV